MSRRPTKTKARQSRGGPTPGVARGGAVAAADLRWTVDPAALGFQTTAELPPLRGMHDQDRALDALHVGADLYGPGYNIYCLNLSGPDRLELARAALRQAAPRCVLAPDRCYVRNFRDADAPKLLELPRGTARRFRRDVDDLIEQLTKHLALVFEEERFAGRSREITEAHQRKERDLLGHVQDLAHRGGFVVAQVEGGGTGGLDLLYRLGQYQVSIGDLESAARAARNGDVPAFLQGAEDEASLVKKLSALDLERVQAAHVELHEMLRRTLVEARRLTRSLQRQVGALEREESLIVVEGVVSELSSRHAKVPAIVSHLEDLKADVLDHLHAFKPAPRSPAPPADEPPSWEDEGIDLARPGPGDPHARYRVNVVLDQGDREDCPILVESNPTRRNLLGSLARVADVSGRPVVDHRSLRAGSLLAADGGYLVIDAADVATDPETWRALKRVLRHSSLDMREAVEGRTGEPSAVLRPDPIPLTVKVVMVGDEATHDFLDDIDPDFKHVFKIRAEFDFLTTRDTSSIRNLGSAVQALVLAENLAPFTAGAIAALAEHAARIAEEGGKMLSRFDLLSDVVRQAAFAAREARAGSVGADHVRGALDAATRRSALRAESIGDAIASGRILINTQGRKLAQVNGLAVRETIDHSFGYPVRITAAVAPGSGGIVNIEREARLSGSIHDKAMLIVQGYLSHRYGRRVPLAFDASVAFEQLYGGIEGDSASAAEIYALLSALSGIPVEQGLAVTGSVNQVGEIQPVGSVNEKIEGFFDACVARAGSPSALPGGQGVVIPRSNVRDLMLRRDVVEAAASGVFSIYGIATIDEGMPLLMGMPAGSPDDEGCYPGGTLHCTVLARLEELARLAGGAVPRGGPRRSGRPRRPSA